MADKQQDKHEKALDLTEAALEALDRGDEAKADKLIDQAKKLDPEALKEVVQDLAEAERAGDSLDEDELDDEDLDEEEYDEEDEEAAG
jgi:hypothetical protein